MLNTRVSHDMHRAYELTRAWKGHIKTHTVYCWTYDEKAVKWIHTKSCLKIFLETSTSHMDKGLKITITITIIKIIIHTCILKREILGIRDWWIVSRDKCWYYGNDDIVYSSLLAHLKFLYKIIRNSHKILHLKFSHISEKAVNENLTYKLQLLIIAWKEYSYFLHQYSFLNYFYSSSNISERTIFSHNFLTVAVY